MRILLDTCIVLWWMNDSPELINEERAEGILHLPDIHRDPFDRIIVAQAKFESLLVLTHDAKVMAYFPQKGAAQ